MFTLWVIVTAKERVFRKPESFIMDARQVCLNFVLERAIIFILLDSKQICPPFPWEALSSRAVNAMTVGILCSQYVQKYERPWASGSYALEMALAYGEVMSLHVVCMSDS